MRKNQVAKAKNPSAKIGKLNCRHRSNILSGVEHRSSKELCTLIKPTFKVGRSSSIC